MWRRTSAPAITIWHPVAPPGYVAVGSVAVAGSGEAPPAGAAWCVRSDRARPADFFAAAAWTTCDGGGGGGGGGSGGGVAGGFGAGVGYSGGGGGGGGGGSSGGGAGGTTPAPAVTLWRVDNDAFTFVAVRGGEHEAPPPNFAWGTS